MPSKDAHMSKARSNDSLSAMLGSKFSSSDWGVTTLFYSALHLVDAYLAQGRFGQHPKDHGERHVAIAASDFLSQIHSQYRELESRSREARYNCFPFDPGFYNNLRQTKFEPLKTHLATRVVPTEEA